MSSPYSQYTLAEIQAMQNQYQQAMMQAYQPGPMQAPQPVEPSYVELPSFRDNFTKKFKRLCARLGFWCEYSNHWYVFTRRLRMVRTEDVFLKDRPVHYWCQACRVFSLLKK